MSLISRVKRMIIAFRFKQRTKVRDNGGLIVKLPKYIQTGNNVFLGENCKLLCWDTYYSGRKNQHLCPQMYIGDNFRATRNLTIQCSGEIRIGANVLVASDVFIIDYNHGINPNTSNYLENNLNVRPVQIEDGVWIGNNVIILPGVRIGKKTIIGAGAVVTKDIPAYCIAVGNPARVIKQYDHINGRWITEEGE